MKTRIIALFAGLLAVLPMSSAWAYDTYYYAQATATVSSTGGGKVYASSTSVTSPDSKCTETTSTSGVGKSAANDQSVTLYRYAKADDGYEFKGWSTANNADISTISDTSTSVTVAPSATSESGADNYTYFAYFTKKQLTGFTVSFLPVDHAAQGSYTVDGATPPAQTATMTEAYTPKLVANPAEGYAVKNWYTTSDGGKTRTPISTLREYTGSFLEQTTVGVEFVQVVPVTTYAELESGLSAGGAFSIADGVEIAIPKDKTLTVKDGSLLVVEGNLFVKGGLTVTGTLSGGGKVVPVKLSVTQGDVVTPANSYANYPSWKYCDTKLETITPKLTGVTATSCGVELKGESYKIFDGANVPGVLICSVDTSKAINYMTAITGSASSLEESLSAGIYLLTADAQIKGPLHTYKNSSGKTYDRNTPNAYVDCAGKKITGSSRAIGSDTRLKVVNAGGVTIGSQVGGEITLVHCSGMLSVSGWNAGNPAPYRLYDCSMTKLSFSYDTNYGGDKESISIYSGKYDAISDTGKTGYFKNGYQEDGKIVIYGGSFKDSMADPTPRLSSAELTVKDLDGYYVVRPNVSETVAEVNGETYESIEEAVAAASDGARILLKKSGIELGQNLEIKNGQSITLDLMGLTLKGGTIVNNGTLKIEDSIVAVTEGTLESAIVNNGTLEVTYGNYAGAITLNAGSSFLTRNGTFAGALNVVDGATVNLHGGMFAQDVRPLLAEGYYQEENGFVGRNPMAKVTNVAGYGDFGFNLQAMESDVRDLYLNGLADYSRSAFADVGKWYQLAELKASIDPVYSSRTIDILVKFDREVKAGTVNVKAKGGTGSLPKDMAAGEEWRALSDLVTGAQIRYSRFIKDTEGNGWDNLSAGAANNNCLSNIGTTCTIVMDLVSRSSKTGELTTTPIVIARESFKFTGKGAIAGGKDYGSLATALENANYSGTVRLSKDCAEEIVIGRVCSFALDNNNFEFTGSIAPADGFEMKVADGVYTFTEAMPEGVAQIGETVYATLAKAVAAAKAGDTIKLMMDDKTDITLPEGVALNTNGRRYSGTITTAEGFKAVHSDGVWSVESAYVATNGGTGYGTLAEALAAEGAEIVIVKACDESVTVGRACTITVAEGVVFSGKISAADGFVIAKSESVWTVSAAAAPIEVNVKVGEAESKAEVIVSSATVEKLAQSEQKLSVAEIQEVVEKAVVLSTSESEQAVKVAEETKEVPVKVTDGFAAVRVTDGKSSVVTELGSTAQAEDQGTGVYQQTKVVEVEGEKIAVPDVTKPVVAVIKDQTTEETIILTVPGDTDKDGNPITVANVIASGMEANDQIKVYNSDGNYRWWEYNGSKWEARLPNKTDAEACQLTAGTAFWYTRAKGNANPIVVVAAYQEELKTDIDSPKEPDEPTVWNLVANANPVEAFDVDSIQCSEEGKSVENDKIIVPLKGLAQRTLTRKNGKWGYIGLERREIKPGKFVGVNKWFECGEEERKIEPGKGFWYLSNGGNPTLNWGKGTDK